jgi:glucoamylase
MGDSVPPAAVDLDGRDDHAEHDEDAAMTIPFSDRPRPEAPGWPGIAPRWTSSVKSGVGTAIQPVSRVWFTLSHGIVNEVYYPSVDVACTRDLGLLITDGAGYVSEEKRHAASVIARLAPGVPAFHLENRARDGRYVIEKDVLSDPTSDVLLQRVRLRVLDPRLAPRMFVLLAPHLANRGSDNTAWVGDYKGVPMLFADRDGLALALACSAPWGPRSAGFVGVSDGWQQLRASGHLAEPYQQASCGNVALVGEIDLSASDGECVLALGFGSTPESAAQRAQASLLDGFDAAKATYLDGWRAWHAARVGAPLSRRAAQPLFDFSAAVLRVHEAKALAGGVIASLSIPWGFEKGDDDLGGYHLVWPRDLVEAGGGFLAAGAADEARHILRFLEVTQEADGHWHQNMWLNGTPYWTGIQMDETALPILLVDLAARTGAISARDRASFWPMVRRAAGFLVRNGPVSPQDRWEEDPGYSPFTIGAEIAALLAAADDADTNGEASTARYLRETADAWFERIDDWMYVRGTSLADRVGVEGYYVRVSAPEEADAASPKDGFVPIKNRPPDESRAPAALTVSPDALALVRFGLRTATDPRIVNTVRVIDDLLRVETPRGPAWRRYNGDGYGEHEGGQPFDGTGVGRAWPLLTAERAHYELAAGHTRDAETLLEAVQAFAGDEQLIPEQVWDGPDQPERELWRGSASGSARPLVWAHAEFIKGCRSLEDGAVFDRPPQCVQRFLDAEPPASPFAIWRFNNKLQTMGAGRRLRVEVLAAATIRWGTNGWQGVADVDTVHHGLGVHVADIDTSRLGAGDRVQFTMYWHDASRWEGVDFAVSIQRAARPAAAVAAAAHDVPIERA